MVCHWKPVALRKSAITLVRSKQKVSGKGFTRLLDEENFFWKCHSPRFHVNSSVASRIVMNHSSLYLKQCTEVFGSESNNATVFAAVEATNKFYGGRDNYKVCMFEKQPIALLLKDKNCRNWGVKNRGEGVGDEIRKGILNKTRSKSITYEMEGKEIKSKWRKVTQEWEFEVN